MTTHARKRFCFTDPEGIENGDVFVSCNFEQLEPNTSILAGKTGLEFHECRLVNCSLPGDAVIVNGNTRQVDFCTNLHPNRVDKGQTACPENCTHVADTDEVWVDGALIDTVYLYEDSNG
jgi:hypothetical protein